MCEAAGLWPLPSGGRGFVSFNLVLLWSRPCLSEEHRPITVAHTCQFVHNQKAIISVSLRRRETAYKVGLCPGLFLPFSPADSEYLHNWDSEETPKSISTQVLGNLCKICPPPPFWGRRNQWAGIRNRTVEIKPNIYPTPYSGLVPLIQAWLQPF